MPPTLHRHERTKREDSERDWTDDAEEYAQDILDQSWGGTCIQDSACLDYVAYCHKDSDIGWSNGANKSCGEIHVCSSDDAEVRG